MTSEDKANIETLKSHLSSLSDLKKDNLAHRFSVRTVYYKLNNVLSHIHGLNLPFLISAFNDLYDYPLVEYGKFIKCNYRIYLKDINNPNADFIPQLPTGWGEALKTGLNKVNNANFLYYTGYNVGKPSCVHKANHKDLNKVLDKDISDVKTLYADLV